MEHKEHDVDVLPAAKKCLISFEKWGRFLTHVAETWYHWARKIYDVSMVVVLVTDWQEGVWWPRGSMSAKAPSRSRRQSPPGPTSGGPGSRWWERLTARSLEVAATAATTTTTTATTTTTTAIASATFFLFLRILSSRSWSACPGVFDHHSFSWVEGYMIIWAFYQYIISICMICSVFQQF